ncbi:hypothetical protein HY838_00430 [Candidatus Azambacteria bacterium]|nr:hypothetical protein [Candidatus Azambacteria bacterium]
MYENVLDLFKTKKGITDDNKGLGELKKWIIDQSSSGTAIRLKSANNPKVSSTRHSIGHPRETVNVTEEDLVKGIEEMEILRKILNR